MLASQDILGANETYEMRYDTNSSRVLDTTRTTTVNSTNYHKEHTEYNYADDTSTTPISTTTTITGKDKNKDIFSKYTDVTDDDGILTRTYEGADKGETGLSNSILSFGENGMLASQDILGANETYEMKYDTNKNRMIGTTRTTTVDENNYHREISIYNYADDTSTTPISTTTTILGKDAGEDIFSKYTDVTGDDGILTRTYDGSKTNGEVKNY